MKLILFSTSMVQAILDGSKTQTRRVMKPQPPDYIDKLCGPEFYEPAIIDKNGEIMPGEPIYGVYDYYSGEWGAKCPYGPGEILWVRETWYKNYPYEYGRYWYRADGEEIDMPTIYGGTVIYGKADGLKWRPSIHMPREAARIFLRVTNVRVERLQEITEEDARAEGVNGIPRSTVLYPNDDYIYPFKQLWNSLNQKRSYGWDTNPWVWVIEFEKISKEEAERLEGMK